MLTVARAFKVSLVHELAADLINGVFAGQHGHDFVIEVTVGGALDSKNGVLPARKNLTEIVNATIVRPLDGQKLNDFVEPASAERLGEYVFNQLKATEIGPELIGVQINETRKNRYQFFKR